MYDTPPSLTSQDSTQSFPVKLPTLEGISIPPLEFDHFPIVSPCISRPSLQCINISVPGPRSKGIARSNGHKHSRSLEIPTDSPSFTPGNSLDSAVSDSFLLPWSKQSGTVREAPSSLDGIYISQSSRKSPFSGIPADTFPSTTSVLDPPTPNFDSEEGGESEEDADSEDLWDLIPYDISWGPTYYGYREGTLPGPEGKCIFLRSPTPLKYQRTGQACEKCRERKAKCSGSRPSCARCTTRGLTCVYASDSKQVKLDGTTNGKDMIAPIDIHHSVQSAEPVVVDSQSRTRVRRNTDCGSHAPRVNIQSRGIELRRRHSTIGSSRSAPHNTSSGHGLRAYREHQVTRASMEGKDGHGYLGALLDPLITFAENGVKGDDHLVSKSNRASYQTLLQCAGSIGSQTVFSSSGANFIEREDGSSYAITQAQTPLAPVQDAWKLHIVDSKELASDGSSLPLLSLASDLSNDGSVVPDCTPSNPGRFQHSDSTYSDECAHRTWHDQSIQAYSTLATGCEGSSFDVPSSSFDYDMLGASSPATMPVGSCWPCDGIAQVKAGLEGYSMEVDAPYIALPNHAPDFYDFDQNETIEAWFPSESR